jgi:hypothetical protein
VPRVRLSWARRQPLRASESSRSHLLVALQLILQLAERVFKAKPFWVSLLGHFTTSVSDSFAGCFRQFFLETHRNTQKHTSFWEHP